MRRLFICIFLIFSLFPVFADEESVVVVDEDVNEQLETFSWEPVAKAKEYGVTIEKKDSTTDEWVEYKQIRTKETNLEVLFTTGEYRVSIATYNILGRKGKSTDWVVFNILEESVPYLNKHSFLIDEDWGAPVLYFENNAAGSPVISDLGTVFPAQGYNENSLLVKGRNIFSPKTEFYLIPRESAPENAQDFVSYNGQRKEQKLKILARKSSDFSVVLSYDPKQLLPGYYDLEVRNPGEKNKDAISILVLDNSESHFSPQSGFEYDNHYMVNSFNITNAYDGTYRISLKGTYFSSSLKFYLEPSRGFYSYPFESQIERSTVPIEVSEYQKAEDSSVIIYFDIFTGELRTGYYNLVVENNGKIYDRISCLVKRPFDHDYTKQVKIVKARYNKRTEKIDIKLSDEKFNAGKTYTLVSEYDELFNSNNRINLNLNTNKKTLVGTISPNDVTIAKYALLIEDENSSDVVYCNIDNRLALKMNKISSEQVNKIFFRPEGKEEDLLQEAREGGIVEFYDNDIQMVKKMPPLFSNIRFLLTTQKFNNWRIAGELDFLNFGFVSLSGNYTWMNDDEGVHNFISTSLRFSIPNMYFSPYLGVGIGEELAQYEGKTFNFNNALQMFNNPSELFLSAQAGVNLFTLVDIRYTLELHGLFDSKYFTDTVSIGFTFPIRAYKFKRKVLTRYANITKDGVLDGTAFIDPTSNVTEVFLYESDTVGGFEGYDKLAYAAIDSTVATVEENAFRNCKKLNEVSFLNQFDEETSLVIKSGAFVDDTQIASIRLPLRTVEVQEGAFQNWTRGQIIVLNWNKDDEKPRNLIGLQNCSATILYSNGEVFQANYKNPLEDARNWISYDPLKINNVSIYKDNSYDLGINLKGYAPSWLRTELYTWINNESPKQVVDYLKNGDMISFKVQGDGNKFDFVITTEEGGYFYYRFKTEADKLTTVEIPYKKLKKYSYSSVKKFDKDKIKMCCIVPMCKGENNDVSFFDFEVSIK